MPIHNTVTTYLRVIFSFCARNLAFGRKFYDVVGLLATTGDKSGDGGEEAGFRFTPGAATAPQLPSLPTTRPSSPVAGPSGIQVRQYPGAVFHKLDKFQVRSCGNFHQNDGRIPFPQAKG
jgi:hypothetical protein